MGRVSRSLPVLKDAFRERHRIRGLTGKTDPLKPFSKPLVHLVPDQIISDRVLSELPQRYMSGWLEENRTTLLISRGVGTEKVPLRIFCRPQIHVITVRRK